MDVEAGHGYDSFGQQTNYAEEVCLQAHYPGCNVQIAFHSYVTNNSRLYSTGEAKSGVHTNEIENEKLAMPIDMVVNNLFILLRKFSYFNSLKVSSISSF